MTWNKVKVLMYGQVEIFTKETFIRMNVMGMVRCFGLTVANIKVNGNKEFNTDLVKWFLVMELSKKDISKIMFSNFQWKSKIIIMIRVLKELMKELQMVLQDLLRLVLLFKIKLLEIMIKLKKLNINHMQKILSKLIIIKICNFQRKISY